MPKKPPRNAYYFFMVDFREEQKKKGVFYNNMAEVQVAADPAWRQGHPSMRAKYEAIAKKEKEKNGVPEKKFTSNGVSLAEIEAEQRMLREIQEQEMTEIKNFVTHANINNKLLEEDIFLIDVNAYCFTGTHYFMAESTILRFSLLEGIKDTYYEAINPGRIPIGYASDVKLGALELGLEMPEEDKLTDYSQVLAYLMDYLKQNSKSKTLPPMYTLTEKVEQAQDFIRQLCIRSGEDDSQLRVYKLDTLFYFIVNAIKVSAEDGYPKPTLATAQIKKDPFKYTPGLACAQHDASDKAVECSKSRVQRWAFTITDKCCPVLGIEPTPGKHVPRGLDIEGVLSYKEHVKETVGSCAASTVGSASGYDNDSHLSYQTGFSWQQSQASKKSTNFPMRLPKTDYSQSLHCPPDLNVTESNFPTLGAGRGRGSINRSLNKLSLNK